MFVKIFFIAAIVAMFGCSDDDGGDGTSMAFTVTSADTECSKLENEVVVPYEGKTYTFNVEAASDVAWTVALEDVVGDWLTLKSAGSYQGNGQAIVEAAVNTANAKQNSGTLVFSSADKKTAVRFVFSQEGKFVQKEFVCPLKDEKGLLDIEKCKLESEDMVLLWHKSFGEKPTAFDPEDLLKDMQEGFDFMIDVAGFANRTTSSVNKYKLIGLVRNDNEGGGITYNKNPVPVFELGVPGAKAKNKYGYNSLMLHELSHSFQFMAINDGAPNWHGRLAEMTSQWSLLKKYPDWGDLEYNHLKAFLEHTYREFLCEENQYHSPYVLEYWERKHDKIVSRIWKENIEEDNNDPVVTYKRLVHMTSQRDFNDEMFDACRRFVTWDIPRIEEAYSKYANQHVCKVKRISSGYYQAAPEYCPENYGYNAIRLDVPAAGTTVKLKFMGKTNLSGFTVNMSQWAGWRYGFVAYTKDGERVYSDTWSEKEATKEFTVPENTACLWLVVMGAPNFHIKYEKGRTYQWPYEFTLAGTQVYKDFIK